MSASYSGLPVQSTVHAVITVSRNTTTIAHGFRSASASSTTCKNTVIQLLYRLYFIFVLAGTLLLSTVPLHNNWSGYDRGTFNWLFDIDDSWGPVTPVCLSPFEIINLPRLYNHG